jgi:GDPmannose 4,6-dehydratase
LSSNPKRALITGITGQDGSYLAELLLEKGYEVHGLIRRASNFNTQRIDHLYEGSHASSGGLNLHYADLTDANSLFKVIREVKPTELYNLAAQSHVRVSFDNPIYTAEATGVGTINLLEGIRQYQDEGGQQVRYYQASTSEMFGGMPETAPQSEETPFHPRSPYGAAKLYSHWITINYRESYDMHASCGILFNHESPRRGETFVTRKITRAVGKIKHGLQDKLFMGNLDAKRDWGFAGDYVEQMWLMLQQDTPDDYVVATGETHTVREFCERAFARVDLDYNDYVEIDPRYYRPAEVDLLWGDPTKAKEKLGWTPKVTFEGLVDMMVDADMAMAAKAKTLIDAGHAVSMIRGVRH